MEKLDEFCAGIWEDNTKTPQQKWMNTTVKKLGQKFSTSGYEYQRK